METPNAQELLEKLDFNYYIKLISTYVEVDVNNLTNLITKQSAIYAYFSGVLSEAKKASESAEIKISKKEAEIRTDLRLKNTSGKRMTDKSMESIVRLHPLYEKLQQEQVECKYKYQLLKNFVDSLEVKKDMLIQLSANSRAETQLYRDTSN